MPHTDPSSNQASHTEFTRFEADGPEVRQLIAALHVSDPMRAAFDVAVRRFVRVERERTRDLDAILATLSGVLRRHVEPTLDPGHRRALHDAALWFAVSEYHRAD